MSNANAKVITDMEHLIAANGRDLQWTREHFGQLVAYFSNTRPTPTPVGVLDAE
jgi:hypothetical protein